MAACRSFRVATITPIPCLAHSHGDCWWRAVTAPKFPTRWRRAKTSNRAAALLAAAIALAQPGRILAADDDWRFLPYEPSYGAYQLVEKDENAIRANYSLKYAIASSRGNGTYCGRGLESCHELFFSYTGQFDFYVGTRSSSPVINRINNPALHYRYYLKRPSIPWVDIALEHRSDGQATEVSTPEQAARAQQAFVQGDHAFFDSISRGANYLSTEVKIAPQASSAKYYAKLKLYLSKDSDITWGPLAGTGTTISDYDRVRLLMQRPVGDGEIAVYWTIGDRGLSTDSWDVSYLFSRKWGLPIALRYHNGPMQTLSNYTESRQSLGIALEFYPFLEK